MTFLSKAKLMKKSMASISKTDFNSSSHMPYACAPAKELMKNVFIPSISNLFIVDITKKIKSKNLFKQSFLNNKTEKMAAEWFLADIFSWIEIVISSHLGLVIVNAVSSDEFMYFNTKHEFLKRILIDIGANQRFDDYIGYLTNYRLF